MTEGLNRPVAQVGSDPKLVAFGEDVRRQALMPGWDFQSAQSNEPVPVEVPYRWSWADVLRPMMVKAYDVVDPVKAERRNLIMSNPGLKRAATTQTLIAAVQGVKGRIASEVARAHRVFFSASSGRYPPATRAITQSWRRRASRGGRPASGRRTRDRPPGTGGRPRPGRRCAR